MTQDIVTEQRGQALWVILNRPDAMNSLTADMVSGISAAVDQAEQDSTIRALVITGTGRAFCAGADLKAVEALADGDPEKAAVALSAFLGTANAVFARLEQVSVPTIAALNGITLGGGLEIALCCDMIVADARARLGDGHANYGFLPGGGGSVRLPRRVGAARAKHIMFTGDLFFADDCLRWGLIDDIAEADQLEERVQKLLSKIVSKSPLGLARMKSLVDASIESTLADALKRELSACDEHAQSYDRNEGLAAFNEKRSPRFVGR
jgi:enoyl-CoA hydratase